MFEFEFLRNKREGIFANLSKLINKFIAFLTDNKIADISDPNIILNNKDYRDKCTSLQTKIRDYLTTYKDI